MQSRRNFLSKVGVCTLLPFIPNLSFGKEVEVKETLFSTDVTLGNFSRTRKAVMLYRKEEYVIYSPISILSNPLLRNRYELVLPGISSTINTKFVALSSYQDNVGNTEILIMENTEENWAKLVQDNS